MKSCLDLEGQLREQSDATHDPMVGSQHSDKTHKQDVVGGVARGG